MSAGVDLSVRTLYDQIWAYARFINEAPGEETVQILHTLLTFSTYSMQVYKKMNKRRSQACNSRTNKQHKNK